jgi:hypothetical protein
MVCGVTSTYPRASNQLAAPNMYIFKGCWIRVANYRIIPIVDVHKFVWLANCECAHCVGRTVRRWPRKKRNGLENVQKFKSINPSGTVLDCWCRVRVPVKQARANICSLRHSLVGPGWPYRIFAVAQIALALNQPTCYQYRSFWFSYYIYFLVYVYVTFFFLHTLISTNTHRWFGKMEGGALPLRLVHPFRCFSSDTHNVDGKNIALPYGCVCVWNLFYFGRQSGNKPRSDEQTGSGSNTFCTLPVKLLKAVCEQLNFELVMLMSVHCIRFPCWKFNLTFVLWFVNFVFLGFDFRFGGIMFGYRFMWIFIKVTQFVERLW